VCSSDLNPTILLAEDNPVNQLLVQRILEKNGYRVLLANDGEEALMIALHQPVDLVLMDVQMPRLDGLEATRRIRLWEQQRSVDSGQWTEDSGEGQAPGASSPHCPPSTVYRPLPIIALTAHAMKGDEQRCLEAGCDGYMSKPIDPDQLLEAIARHLLSHEAAQPAQAGTLRRGSPCGCPSHVVTR